MLNDMKSSGSGRIPREESNKEEMKIMAEDEEYRICNEKMYEATGGPDYEEAYKLYLSKVVDYEAMKWGPFTVNAEIEKWHESRVHPLEITISLEYKSGDGADRPYITYLVDKQFLETFRRHGWKVKVL